MEYEQKIIEAFESNEIQRILLIDDAYDCPEINEEHGGDFLDFFNDDQAPDFWNDIGVQKEILDLAVEAAMQEQFESDEFQKTCQALYDEFVKTKKPKYDPGGHFNKLKEPSLNALKPLEGLLRKCGNQIDVRTAGLKNGPPLYDEFHPQVLFLDYYLSDDIPVAGDIEIGERKSARAASLSFLNGITREDAEDIPAIVLMSSRQIGDEDRYRQAVEGKHVMSLRFGFLKKDSIELHGNNNKILIKHEAADTLLDMSQGYLFGRFIEQALGKWKSGAEEALNRFMKDIGDLHTKDFAYLMRFRLQEEGQPLSEYLEWFFGECLKGQINEKVDWKHNSFSRLDGEDRLDEKIEGVLPEPSIKVAEIFDRIRVNRSHNKTDQYRLGNLYVQPKGHTIRAIITPDCDLVERGGKFKAERVLTMGGTLHKLENTDSFFTDNLFIRGGTPYSIKWNPKDLITFPLTGKDSLKEIKSLCFCGTLNPLYAQAVQRYALTDLSRIGLPTSPALGIKARVKVWIWKKKGNGSEFEQIEILSDSATIFPARAGEGETDKHKLLMNRGFVYELVDHLKRIQGQHKLEKGDDSLLNKILKNEGKVFYEWLLQKGADIESPKYGVSVVIGNKPMKRKKCTSWLQITATISEEALKELNTSIPLVN